MPVATPTILTGTTTMPATYRLLSIDVRSEVDRVPCAEIRLLDGNALNEYAVSDGSFFAPGSPIEIKLRYEGKTDTSIFTGVVVRQSLEWGGDGSIVVVYLKDAAVKLTGARRSAVFDADMTDDRIIKELLNAAGVKVGTIAPTSPKHRRMVQYDCTAWDFIVLRAEALGMLVTVEAGAVSVTAMTAKPAATHTFAWGTGMYDFEVEANAENPYASIESVAWDPANNALTSPAIQADADAGTPPGDLNPRDLAAAVGRDARVLMHPVPAAEHELELWANARMARSRLSTLRGRIAMPGDASIKLLDAVKLSGVGKRFSGEAMVTGIRHRYDASGWQTEAQLGLSPDRLCQRDDIAGVPAAGLLPPVRGLQIGVVTNSKDPDGEHRIEVILPGVAQDASRAVWARLASLDAGKDHGCLFRPEPNDEVVVGFLFNDPRHPVILGSLFGSKNKAPAALTPEGDQNADKGFVTRSGTIVRLFDGDKPAVHIATAAGNKIVIDDAAPSIQLTDQNNHSITLDSNGITIDAGNGSVTIKGSKVDIQ